MTRRRTMLRLVREIAQYDGCLLRNYRGEVLGDLLDGLENNCPGCHICWKSIDNDLLEMTV